MKIIGRKEQQEELTELVASQKPEFIVLYGRRRVGKTFLIKEFFNNSFAFYHTGLANSGMRKQLASFAASLALYGKQKKRKTLKNWFDAFLELRLMLETQDTDGKQVVFIDEAPWMDSQRSDFVSAIEHFWNSWASSRPNMLLILCGSATSWIISKILNNHGGLHNRVTQKIMLEPFTLAECELFFRENNIEAERIQILDYYMILGGIPFYLNLLKKKYGVAQNIDMLFFKHNATLNGEFDNLYASLFRHSENYIKIVETLSEKVRGMTRKELIDRAKALNGGGTTKILKELEECGFIRRYCDFGKTRRESIYQLTDFFTLFYFRFINNRKNNDENFWTNTLDTSIYHAWSGLAFELVALAHIRQIKASLGINGVLTSVSEWHSKNSQEGAQIDLVIDRNDKIINLCEMKYSNDMLLIDKEMDADLRHKKQVFRTETGTRKALHTTIISTYGVKRNSYSGNIQSQITVNDLFT
jgi:AAA+ ATPase superfamily predicted ATPase